MFVFLKAGKFYYFFSFVLHWQEGAGRSGRSAAGPATHVRVAVPIRHLDHPVLQQEVLRLAGCDPYWTVSK